MKTSLALLVPVAAVWIACGQRIEADKPVASSAEPLVKASPAPPPEVPLDRVFRTTLYSERDVDVTARTEGVIRSVVAELGDAVADGAVLALLEDEREAAALQSAQAALDLARARRARASTLRASEMITQSELDAAVYEEKAAEAATRTAQVELGYTRVRAPFRGQVAQRYVRVGQTVRVGEPLFRVTASAPLRAALRIPEREAGPLTTGSTLTLSAADGSSVPATVVRISPTVDPASGTIELLLDVARPGGLRPGSAVTLLIGAAAARKTEL